MLAVLAVHLDATKSAIDVPNLQYPEGTSPDLPIGAIGLAAAAVRSRVGFSSLACDTDRLDQLERIFKLYAGRFMRPEEKKGDENKKKKKKGLWKPIPRYNPNSGRSSTSYSEFSEVKFQGPMDEYAERAGKMSQNRIAVIVDAAREHMGKRSANGEQVSVEEVEVHGRNELADDDDDENDENENGDFQ